MTDTNTDGQTDSSIYRASMALRCKNKFKCDEEINLPVCTVCRHNRESVECEWRRSSQLYKGE